MNIRNKIFAILAVAWMIFIFSMSAQPADESTHMSLRAGRLICSVFVPHYSDMSPARQTDLAKRIDHPVRKSAHATEYAILSILLFLAIPHDRYHRYLISLILTAAYASSDEIHQLFVPGRAGMVTDVCIDTCGAIAGLLITYMIKRLTRRKY